MGRLEDQRPVSTAAAIEKSGTAYTMVGQKSGPALATMAVQAYFSATNLVCQREIVRGNQALHSNSFQSKCMLPKFPIILAKREDCPGPMWLTDRFNMMLMVL